MVVMRRRRDSTSVARPSDDLRRADDGLGPMQFGSIVSPVYDFSSEGGWVAGEPSRGLPAWTAVMLSATSGVLIVFVGYAVMFWNAFANYEHCSVLSTRPSLTWMVGVIAWAACALLVPVLVAGRRRRIGWICGGLAVLLPLLNVAWAIWNLLTPESSYPTYCLNFVAF
jgi:hypothetical protein